VNVIITLPSLADPGGVAGYYRAVLPALTARGVYLSPLEIGGTSSVLRFLHPLRDQIALAGLMRRKSFDIVHVNPSLDPKSFTRDGLFVLQAQRKKLRTVVFFHGWLASFERVIEGFLYRFFRATYGRVNSFVVLSSAFADKLREWGASAPIHVATTAIPDDLANGFSLDRKVQMIMSDSVMRVLFLARLEKAKGVFETIEAVNILLKRGIDVRLDIAGDGSAADQVREYLGESGPLSQHVRLLGYVRGEQKKEVLASNQIYCLPSQSEGMPVSVLEAMAFGMPIVARSVGGLKDLLQEGRTGYAICKSDPEDLADLLQKLISDRQGMASIARFNSAYVKQNCLASHAARTLLKIYQEAYAR
jgi:glycosyltransferase involved in cell wall biosynthesis